MSLGIALNWIPQTQLFGAASEFWMTRWLTPYWLIGVGVGLGFVLLVMLVGLFAGLSKLSILEKWRRNGVAFWGGLIVSMALTFMASIPLKNQLGFEGDEQILASIALWPFIAMIVWSFLYCGQVRFLGELWGGLVQGLGSYLSVILVTIGIVGLSCTFVVDEPKTILANLLSVFTLGESTMTFPLPGNDPDVDSSRAEFVPLPLRYDPRYVRRVIVNSDRNIILADGNDVDSFRDKPVRIEARNEVDWTASSSMQPPIPMVIGGNVFAQNLELDPATVTFKLTTVPEYPEASTILLIATIVFVIGLAWMLQQAAAPKITAIAMAAGKSEFSQPLPLALLLFGGTLLLAFVFVPFYTDNEDIKLLKDCGLTLILLICLFQGVWSASSSVSEEIEGRTALTLLSKPIRRRSFLLGKMLGIAWLQLLMLLILGALLLLLVAYKPIYDAREATLDQPLWQICHFEMIRTLPGLAMVYMQAVTMSAIAVALATRLPLLANFSICFTLYFLGHLTPAIVSSTVDSFPIIQFVSQLIAVVVPTLDWYSMDKAIDSGHRIPTVYLASLLVYSGLYTTFAVFLGLLLFEDRDLA